MEGWQRTRRIAGVARRWRIRHKLLLGLATAIAILGLLLAGTLNGLWSYYVTMKSIASKLGELEQADKLKVSVAHLALPDGNEDPLKVVYRLKDELIHQAEKDLASFETAFNITLNKKLTPDDGAQLAGQIGAMRHRLEQLRQVCDGAAQEMCGHIYLGGPQERFRPWREQIQDKVHDLDTAAIDLRSVVLTDLMNRIDMSKENYKVTLALLITVSVLSVLLMLSALRFFYYWIFSPVRDLQQGVTRVAKGDFEHRIEVHSGDEMEELAAAYNDMTCRLRDLYRDMARQINDRSRQLVRSEQLASVGFLAAGVAHEINNPLASIAFCSEALEARLEELREQSRHSGRGEREVEVFSKYLKMIQDEAFRCKKITERLLEVSRGGEDKRDRTDLGALIQSVLEVAEHHPACRGKHVIFQPGAPVHAWVCVEEIKSVVLNLVFNALESVDEGGRLTIELRQREGMAEMVFSDTGCGMTQEVLDNIFEPFFTRSRSGKGTGLGLTITHRIVSQHGGEIEAASPGPDQGSTFRVRLPLLPPAENGEERPEPRDQSSERRDRAA
jgi:signal transduction histidine kinase